MPAPPKPDAKAKEDLDQLFNRCRLSQAMKDHLLKLGVESLQDFVGLVDSTSSEAEIKSLIVDKSACKDDLVQLSRVRNAWKEAHGQVEKTRKRKLEGLVEEGDDPLDTSTQESLLESFGSTYGIKLTMHEMPADSLLGRVYREFQRGAPTMIPARKELFFFYQES